MKRGVMMKKKTRWRFQNRYKLLLSIRFAASGGCYPVHKTHTLWKDGRDSMNDVSIYDRTNTLTVVFLTAVAINSKSRPQDSTFVFIIST